MKKIVITSLTCFISTVAFADQDVVVPTLEGGLTASIGTFYATPSTGDYNYANHITMDHSGAFPSVTTPAYNTTDYDFGFAASLGYLFEETANGVELSYRGFHSSTDASVTSDGTGKDFIGVPGENNTQYVAASNELTYDFDTVDLMFSQFVNFGEFVQMRFSGGLAYVFIKQKSQTYFDVDPTEADAGLQVTESKFNGLGPRLGTDGRYDFGDGFGVLGGVSLAYLIGDLDSNNQFFNEVTGVEDWDYEENIDNHAVLNVRANLGIDYVFFIDNDEGSTVGVELGYLADYYVEAVNEITGGNEAHTYGPSSVLQSASFAGPYLNVKGVF